MTTTPNIGLSKPIRGSQRWDTHINANSDNIDTHIGGLNNAIDDLPEVERHAGIFNSSTGAVVSLSKTVGAVNEYGIEIVPTSRAAAIGDIWVTKGTSSFTVHCSGGNTADTFEAVIFHTGDMTSYGGSMYRRYYVSPSTSITDHSVVATVGSLAYILNAMSGTSGIIELPGNRTYTLTANDVTIPAGIRLLPQPGAVISIASGKTLTINGTLEAARQKVFSGDGDVVFGAGSVEWAFPEWFGAIADGTTDSGAYINNLADACRANVVPIKFGFGHYYTTVSLNFTGANYDIGYGGQGWVVSGCGAGATLITGNLSAGYAIVDMTDNGWSKLKNLRVQGHASGSQLCGVLHGMVGSVLSLQNTLANVLVAGVFAEAAYINHSADLAKIKDSYLDGPCGAIFTTDTSACGAGVIQSAYQTLTATPNVTLLSIEGSQIIGNGGDSQSYESAILMHEVLKITIDAATYLAQAGNAKAGIYVYGRLGGIHDTHQIVFRGRYENQTSPARAGTFLWHDSSTALRNCVFEGFLGSRWTPDSGQWFYLQSGDISFSKIMLDPVAATQWSHVVQRAGTTAHVIRDSEIIEQTDPGTLLHGLDAAIFGGGNRIHVKTWHANWQDVTGITSCFSGDKGQINLDEHVGLNVIGKTSALARQFCGHVRSDWLLSYNTGPSGSDITEYTYELPGDICSANTAQNRAAIKIVLTGWCIANANPKTIKVKFGPNATETTVIYNDVTANPNNRQFRVEIDIMRVNLTEHWEYSGSMIVGSAVQSISGGVVSAADPTVVTNKLLVTVNAAAGDVLLRAVSICIN